MNSPPRSKQVLKAGVDGNDKGVSGQGNAHDNNAALLAVSLSRFETAFREAENNLLAGRKIPRLLDFFPFNRSKSLHNLFARLDRFFRGKEYEINLLLARALRDVLTVYEKELLDQRRELQKQGYFLSEDEHRRLDALYIDFENRFRGSQDEIKQRQNIYLPFIREALTETKEGLVVDIGSGRGEWLESLRENGFQGVGIEANSIAVKASQERGLKVIEGDALAYLRDVPNESLAAITCFHVVEHLPFHMLVQLLDEMVRTLRVGGIAILETPNPQNVLVGSNNFYYDPTHRNPIPSLTLKFIAEARGLGRVEAVYLHPYPDSYKVDGSVLAERFNEYFYCAQDYAVIGYK